MGKKRKRDDTSHAQSNRKGGIVRRHHSQSSLQNSPGAQKGKGRLNTTTSQSHVKTPFEKFDRVLLVGEGDFSFALSLATGRVVGAVTATSFDTLDELKSKYSGIEKTLKRLTTNPGATTPPEPSQTDDQEEWTGFSDESSEITDAPPEISVLHGIDATKLATAHRNVLKPHSPFTKIVFNFPHTGGLSTDVNRQVRANQQLLVSFFNAAKPLLATDAKPARPLQAPDDDIEYYSADEETKREHLGTGRIIVTLFEGEPYSLWNIRDLARHCGLQVVESFRFPWSKYPGYTHARTIGDVLSGKDRTEDGKRKGAWRGEERDARSYVLTMKEDAQDIIRNSQKKKKKKKRRNDSDDSD